MKSLFGYLPSAFLITAIGLQIVPYASAQNASVPLSFEVASVKAAAADQMVSEEDVTGSILFIARSSRRKRLRSGDA